ncbi:MAG TPA: hypothetical protein VND96_03360 [Candidatus Micrarchaeaceae archaeon]|nr:hypothetical protein [Candidatus Micrarchaeaceae archaeon]
MSPDVMSTRPLLDKLGVKPGAKVAIVNLDDEGFITHLRTRTRDIVKGKPSSPADLVFFGAETPPELDRIDELKGWIEPNGGIWVVRTKGGGGMLRDTDVVAAGLAAGLVDNKIASFSETQGAMRLVFRVRDRPRAVRQARAGVARKHAAATTRKRASS